MTTPSREPATLDSGALDTGALDTGASASDARPPRTRSILLGDCLDLLPTLGPPFAHLAYLDPPFNTGAAKHAEAGSYPDRWDSMTDYLAFLRPRIAATIDALVPSGSILVHVDWRTAHHVRLLLDDLLGPDAFVNHLIWSYGLGGSSPRRFARKHDDILFYARRDDYYFQPPRVPATSNRMRGQTKKATDVLDIPAINNMARERTGYPTQKPLALLELLIDACCPPDGHVLDPFCGSGTTIAAAHRTHRHATGIDVSPSAVKIAETR